MKMPIAWHEECLKSISEANNRRSLEAMKLMEDVVQRDARISFYWKQIEEAKRRKKDGFDRDQFMKGKS